MAERITTAGRNLLASHQGNGTHLPIDKFILAYISGQDPATEVDPDRGLPSAGQIVHDQAVTKDGYMSPDMVSYSLYMDDTVGDFTFNTIYTVATGESNAVIQIITMPDTPKIAADPGSGVRGQPMVRNAVLVYDDAAAITNITVEAEAWQFAYEKATEDNYGLAREATLDQVKSGFTSLVGLLVSPEKLVAWWDSVRTWGNIKNKPSTFPPSSHSHSWSSVSGKPSTFPPSSHGHSWNEVSGKPSTFPPSSHGHSWNEVSGKPSSYPPSSHTHTIANINGLQAALDVARIVGEIVFFSFDNPPAGFFALDGSTILNGRYDFSELANSGSTFITVSGNNIILKDCSYFIRGKGSSSREIGYYEGDAIRDFSLSVETGGGDGTGYANSNGVLARSSSKSATMGSRRTSSASDVVPTASENRPKSLTALFAIYHGVVS